MEAFEGLIQHSFALQIDKERAPFEGRGNRGQIAERFLPAGADHDAYAVCGVNAAGTDLERAASHSPLAQHGLMGIRPLGLKVLDDQAQRDPVARKAMHTTFGWAFGDRGCASPKAVPPAMIFAGLDEESGEACINDFHIVPGGAGCEADSVSRVLLELMAHKRSRLFGIALADRFVNVMLPWAILKSASGGEGADHGAAPAGGAWFLQPLVTFIRDGHNHDDFRRTYSLTFFLIPIEGPERAARPMATEEIDSMVNAGWGLAASRPNGSDRAFDLRGPLPEYVSRLARYDLERLLRPPSAAASTATAEAHEAWDWVSLRRASEVLAFGVSLGVSQGPFGQAESQARRRIGDDVIIALCSARVSSVVVVDPDLDPAQVRKPIEDHDPPGSLRGLLSALAHENRAPEPWAAAERRRHRLDRPFFDAETYAVGVLPHDCCMVVASAACAQDGVRESALMQAGSAAYMTIGAATAIGTLRAIDRDLEKLETASPEKIARIDGEIATDLHEIYDLDVTRESFRRMYHRLRERLGIVGDYENLQDKMNALYRATSTRHELASESQLTWLTVAIVLLSLLIVIGTLVVAANGG